MPYVTAGYGGVWVASCIFSVAMGLLFFTMSHIQLPEPKRRKTVGMGVHVTLDGTEIRSNGTMTPSVTQDTHTPDMDDIGHDIHDIGHSTLGSTAFSNSGQNPSTAFTTNTASFSSTAFAATSTASITTTTAFTKNTLGADIFPSDDMDTTMMSQQCPCGYLHGPDSLESHDISAVGFSNNMMRGPD